MRKTTILSLLLALVMVLGMLTVSAFATDSDSSATEAPVVKITHISINPANDALGFKAKVEGNSETVTQIGFAFRVNGGAEKVYTLEKTPEDGIFTARVKDILANNGGEATLEAYAFVRMGDVQVTSKVQSTTMKHALQIVDATWHTAGYTQSQKAAVVALCEKYQTAVESWQLGNILNDLGLLTVTFADVQLVNVHQGSIVNGPKALRDHLNYAKSIHAEVLFMPGDIVNNADQSYYDRFWSIFKSVYGEDESQWPEFVWAMGNHEWYDLNEKDAADAIAMFKANANIESDNLVKMSQVPSEANPGQMVANYYKVIKGVPFVVISGDSRANTVTEAQKAELISWLDEINQLPSVKAGTPIYVAYHIPIADVTYFGQGAGEGSRVVDDILKRYPNTIVFTGDTHCPGINERTINQIDYTSINLGSSSYSRMVNRSATSEPGDRYYNVGGNNAKDIVNGEVAFGYQYTPNLMVLKNYTNGCVDMNRYWTETDPADVRQVGITWNFPSGLTKDKFIYTYDRFENKEWANILYGKDGLIFAEDAGISFDVDGTQMMVYFDDVTDHNYAEHYKITVTADGTTSKVYDVVGNYYKYYEEAQTYHIPLVDIPEGSSYTVEVKAYDFFDNVSLNSLVATVESATNLFHNQVEGTISATYTDISSKINYEVTAGGVASLEYFYQGEYLYNAGAILGTVINADNLALAEEFTVTDWSHGILTAKVLNAGDVAINVGLTVVLDENGQEKWVTDFGGAHRYVVAADGQWAELTWDLYELFGITSLEDINAIRIKANSTAPSEAGYQMHLYVDDVDILQGEHVDVEDPEQPEDSENVYGGGQFAANTGLTLDLPNDQEVTGVSFDYTIESGEYFHIAFMPDWQNFFGYFKFDANGVVGSYPGVTTKKLSDGKISVTIDLSAVTTVSGNPSKVLTILYARGNWTTANGTIDNIRFALKTDEPEAPEDGTVFEGGAVVPGTTLVIDNTQPVTKMSFDYKIESGDKISLALLEDWSNGYGYFDLTTAGYSHSGVTTEALANGYIRVYVDFAEVTKTIGAPSGVITMLYVHGSWTTATGVIENICINGSTQVPPRGTAFSAGTDLTTMVSAKQNLATLSFEYKITAGEKFNIALLPNWSAYFGYFEFVATGANGTYNGVTTEVLSDGYIRVTFDMDQLTKMAGTPSTVIDFMYLRGGWSDASGYIDNVQFTTK